MKASPIRPDERRLFAERPGVGVRPSETALLSYDLTVVAADASDVVAGAGGWLCDRVRAGWKVNVVVPESCDVRPLEILGVRTWYPGRDARELPAEPAALAIPAGLFATDQGLRRRVTGALRRGTAEVTMWGQCSTTDVGYRVDRTQYRLSTAARAFKAQALAAAGIPTAVSPVEQFHSCALWYPADGPDLTAVR
ncbi:hypothetical protein L2K20_13735 [Mycobacterium sp. MBM]|nr:hypothetical protein [Mycobacterium sp. MBM]